MSRDRLDGREILELRAQGMKWAEIGREIARRRGRVVPYTDRAVLRVATETREARVRFTLDPDLG
jgi:hypothetical protein